MNPSKVLPWIQLASVILEAARQVDQDELTEEEIEARWAEVTARAGTAGERWRATRAARKATEGLTEPDGPDAA